jgi:thioredoxin reductase
MSRKISRRWMIGQAGKAILLLAIPMPLKALRQLNMNDSMIAQDNDVIIIGGSYAGLSAAMALGRSMRKVLIIDSGDPCNKQTPHSHNFLTRDGERPAMIADKAREQVLAYPTVQLLDDRATSGKKTTAGFSITTGSGRTFHAKKLVFATGVKDQLPSITGFDRCWGISVIHCPYCHGYEVRNKATGILANGDIAFHYAQLISHWTKDLTIFTNGASTLTKEQNDNLALHNIQVVEKDIELLGHNDGKLQLVVFKDGTSKNIAAIYARPAHAQHCDIPAQLGCELTEQGLLKVDPFQKTTIPGVFACGDNASPLRAVSGAVYSGTLAGTMANKEMIEEFFG